MLLKDFILNNKSYLLGAQADDWKSAVKYGIDLLVKAGAAKECYYDAVLQIAEEHGPYYVIAPGIAMPHARPESGALATGFSLVTLSKPVKFGHADNDPVDIILCICAKNKEDLNEEAIVNAVTLLEDDGIIERLRGAKTESQLKAIFEHVEQMNDM